MARAAYETANGLLAAARDAGVDESLFHQLPGWRANELLDQVLDTFTKQGRRGRLRYWMWEDFREPSLCLPNGHDIALLTTLGSGTSRVWLIVEDFSDSKAGAPFWLFEATLDAIALVLRNHHHLEFYVVSRDLTWLIGQNHHDCWFAAGKHALATLQPMAPPDVLADR